jgi:hypothetical protein
MEWIVSPKGKNAKSARFFFTAKIAKDAKNHCESFAIFAPFAVRKFLYPETALRPKRAAGKSPGGALEFPYLADPAHWKQLP